MSQAGSAAAVSPRVICDDDCVSASLPSGITGSGSGLSFDSTNLCRILAPGGLTSPQIALRGPLIVDTMLEFTNGFAAGNCQVGFQRHDNNQTIMANFQSDGNMIVYGWDATHLFSKGSGNDPQGHRLRVMLSLSDLQVAGAVQLGVSFTEGGVEGGVGAGWDFHGQFTALTPAAGVGITAFVVTDTTRAVRLYNFQLRRGRVTP